MSEDVEVAPPPSGPGSVVLDIGGSIGAAIVTTPAALAGLEVEIRAVDADWDGTHVAVHERRVPGGPVYAAVFPSLAEGAYAIRLRHGPEGAPTGALRVRGGSVTSVEWGG